MDSLPTQNSNKRSYDTFSDNSSITTLERSTRLKVSLIKYGIIHKIVKSRWPLVFTRTSPLSIHINLDNISTKGIAKSSAIHKVISFNFVVMAFKGA